MKRFWFNKMVPNYSLFSLVYNLQKPPLGSRESCYNSLRSAAADGRYHTVGLILGVLNADCGFHDA